MSFVKFSTKQKTIATLLAAFTAAGAYGLLNTSDNHFTEAIPDKHSDLNARLNSLEIVLDLKSENAQKRRTALARLSVSIRDNKTNLSGREVEIFNQLVTMMNNNDDEGLQTHASYVLSEFLERYERHIPGLWNVMVELVERDDVPEVSSAMALGRVVKMGAEDEGRAAQAWDIARDKLKHGSEMVRGVAVLSIASLGSKYQGKYLVSGHSILAQLLNSETESEDICSKAAKSMAWIAVVQPAQKEMIWQELMAEYTKNPGSWVTYEGLGIMGAAFEDKRDLVWPILEKVMFKEGIIGSNKAAERATAALRAIAPMVQSDKYIAQWVVDSSAVYGLTRFSGLSGYPMPTTLRAAAMSTMLNACASHQELAKELIPKCFVMLKSLSNDGDSIMSGYSKIALRELTSFAKRHDIDLAPKPKAPTPN
ncbi:MAG: hypothetical protein MRY79_06545 [Alphaproteobacteria bacterium]|nr:hypothetical protein [Alphaproteobacteria bacterium]